jgi:transcriptional regulator with XRE-family HTH domain
MATKKKSATMKFLDELIGEPLTFAGMVRNVRETDGYTLASMGKKLGCSAQFLSDVEHARRTVSPKLAARWAKALGYHPVVWVQHALQAEVDAAGLKLRVTVEAA